MLCVGEKSKSKMRRGEKEKRKERKRIFHSARGRRRTREEKEEEEEKSARGCGRHVRRADDMKSASERERKRRIIDRQINEKRRKKRDSPCPRVCADSS